MVEYQFDKAKQEIENLFHVHAIASITKEVEGALSLIQDCQTVFDRQDLVEAMKLKQVVLTYYKAELNWLAKYEAPFLSNKQKKNQPTFWESFVGMINMIPFYALIKVGKTELVKSMIVLLI